MTNAINVTTAAIIGSDLDEARNGVKVSATSTGEKIKTYSRMMDTKGEKMLRRDYVPEARLAQHLKDVRLILAQANAAGVQLPLSEAHQKVLERAEAAGLGGADNSALIEVLRARGTPPISSSP